MTVFADQQSFDVGSIVSLFDLDITPIVAEPGIPVYYFTPSSYLTTEVMWRGNTYTPIDVQATGFEKNISGSLPRPKISVSGALLSTTGIMSELNILLMAYDNLRGARITRWRTLKTYLDNETTSDVSMFVQVDVYVINQKTQHNKYIIEWELAALFDYTGQKLPRRQMLKDFCTHVYRTWNGSSFDYNPSRKGTTCPYNDVAIFTKDGEVAASEAYDVCGKRTHDCLLRYPNSPLPTTAFPLISDTRIR